MSADVTAHVNPSYVIAPPKQAAIAIAGSDKMFPVRRIWCVGRNYEEHIREMGHDVRDPPFFFSKPADAIVADGANVPYPPLTKDMHHEVELVVALKSGGRNIPLDKAFDCIYGYGVGIDLTRRDLQIASRDMKRAIVKSLIFRSRSKQKSANIARTWAYFCAVSVPKRWLRVRKSGRV